MHLSLSLLFHLFVSHKHTHTHTHTHTRPYEHWGMYSNYHLYPVDITRFKDNSPATKNTSISMYMACSANPPLHQSSPYSQIFMMFFSCWRAATTSGGSAAFAARRSRWSAALGIWMADRDGDRDCSTPPPDQGSCSPLLHTAQVSVTLLMSLSPYWCHCCLSLYWCHCCLSPYWCHCCLSPYWCHCCLSPYWCHLSVTLLMSLLSVTLLMSLMSVTLLMSLLSVAVLFSRGVFHRH